MFSHLQFSQRMARQAALAVVLAAGIAQAQLSPSAYRVLGQPDLHQRSVNTTRGTELNSPSGIALDARKGEVHLYIADTNNSRVLAWQDIGSYSAGDAPALVLAQPGPQYSNPLGIGPMGLNSPLALAVDPATGNLYVADYGNNRVLRFPSPFENRSRVQPDAVYGQPNFTTTGPGVSKALLYRPRALAFDSEGNLWVADSGNNRVLRFGAASLNNAAPEADTVIGQKDFTTGFQDRAGAVSASGLDMPSGLAFDAQDNLYVSDYNNTRVLRFPAPLGPSTADAAANAVWGEADFATRGAPRQATSSSLAGPAGISIDKNGNLYVATPNDNRVLVFSLKTPGAAVSVLGQSTFSSTAANADAVPRASANTLSGATDVKVDPSGNVVVVDSGNHRVLLFPAGSKAASRVWGQSDFISNGANQIKPGSLNQPFKVVIDYSKEPFALYVSDTGNNRVLVWKDAARFRNGDPADLAIGQPDLLSGAANADMQAQTPSKSSLWAPTGLAINPYSGVLYVADSGNNRVLRYPRPVDQSGRITPDAVIGQPDFTSSNSTIVNGGTLRTPSGLAFAANGRLFVADTGNNRVLEFADGAGSGAVAIRVYGQPHAASSTRPSQVSPQTLTAPQGVFVDDANNLYVTDSGASRVLIFSNTQIAPPAGAAANFVLGQEDFTSVSSVSSSSLRAPTDVVMDRTGQIYVADYAYSRVLVFPALLSAAASAGVASQVIGQKDLTSARPNWDSADGLATADSLYTPMGLLMDRQDTLYVVDSGNNRVAHFLKAGPVANGATFQANAPIAQGSLATMFGSGLASDSAAAQSYPLPRALADRELVVNDEPAPLFYVGPGQVNFQAPSRTALGAQRVAVRVAGTKELLAGGSMVVGAVMPALYNSGGQAVAVNQNGTLNGASNAAPKGSVITLYGTGQGQVSPAVEDGAPSPSSPPASTITTPTTDGKTCLNTQPSMCVAIGSSWGEILFSGLAPNLAGVWQINVKIPQDALSGNAVPLLVVINGMPSNTVKIAIK